MKTAYVFKFCRNHAESFQNLRHRAHHRNYSFSKRCIRDVDFCTALIYIEHTIHLQLMMAALSNRHYSGHRNATQEKDNQ